MTGRSTHGGLQTDRSTNTNHKGVSTYKSGNSNQNMQRTTNNVMDPFLYYRLENSRVDAAIKSPKQRYNNTCANSRFIKRDNMRGSIQDGKI